MRLAVVLLATGVAACAADSSTTPTGGGGGGGKADGDGRDAAIVFAGDFTESVSGTLVAGGSVQIAYDLDRMQTCRGETNGSDAWGVGGYAQFDGGTPVAFAVSQIANGTTHATPATLAIPAGAKSVALWFEQTDVFGCHAYDSNESANYTFAIAPGATTGPTFDFEVGAEDLPAVHAGDRVTVHYDPARLATCQSESGGRANWGVTGYYQVDGGSVHALAVAVADGEDLVPADPTFTVPRGGDVALWFEATNAYGCHAYDSADGANYHATID